MAGDQKLCKSCNAPMCQLTLSLKRLRSLSTQFQKRENSADSGLFKTCHPKSVCLFEVLNRFCPKTGAMLSLKRDAAKPGCVCCRELKEMKDFLQTQVEEFEKTQVSVP